MSIDWQNLRLDGVYRMNDADELMLRIKVPAGVLSAEQAEAVAELAERFGGGIVHLTVRGSLELHRLSVEQLPVAWRRLAAVGLTTRGACGGAVRGVSCSTTFAGDFAAAQIVARDLHRHFAGNPHFEGLAKKFKIGVDGGYGGSRHLIQDVGLVLNGTLDGQRHWDVWLAGGLGREPQAAFFYAGGLPEGRLIPLIEAVLRLYRRHAPKGRRLKYVLRQLGEATFRGLLQMEFGSLPVDLRSAAGVEKSLLPPTSAAAVTLPVFAGELIAADLYSLADIARCHGGGFLALTADQDIALFPTLPDGETAIRAALAAAGMGKAAAEEAVTFRICPGGHDCRLGLAPTRDIARLVLAEMSEAARHLTWAIAGCANSCSQPQLAQVGISTSKSLPDASGGRSPRFDLWRGKGKGLGEKVAVGLTLEELLEQVRSI